MNLTISAKKRAVEPPGETRPRTEVETLTLVDTETREESFVYVHCYFRNTWKDMLVRIWKTTYLVDKSSGSRSGLVHTENISLAPVWTHIPDGKTYEFLLIFSALPKSCQSFDLLEDITQPGGFFIENIPRNETDVYHIDLN